jgi:hypothetical protein
MARTVADVRGYLADELNSALRRPSMYGGESALLIFFDAMAFVDDRERDWRGELDALRNRGASVSTGASGAVEQVLGERSEYVMASVYADLAHRHGWLKLDRPLGFAEYDRIRRDVEAWCSSDRTMSGTLAEFGPPSILVGGNNPRYPKTIGYGTAQTDQPLVFLHLWNGTEPAAASPWPPDHAEPLLLAARRPGERFLDEFVFTPMGARRRQQLGAQA